MECMAIERNIEHVLFSKSPKAMAKHSSGAACVYDLRNNVHQGVGHTPAYLALNRAIDDKVQDK